MVSIYPIISDSKFIWIDWSLLGFFTVKLLILPLYLKSIYVEIFWDYVDI